MQIENTPTLTINHPGSGAGSSVIASGVWQVHGLSQRGVLKGITRQLQGLKDKSTCDWDLTGVESLDHIGAQLFWNTWNKQRPQRLTLDPRQEDLFASRAPAASNSRVPAAARSTG
jgi:phospholipid/cholesterol/gamma-HCH transport system permease protein